MNLPLKENTSNIAQRIAKFGFNAVRLHGLDLFLGSYPDINPNNLDKLDYFISELKENGIYITIGALHTFSGNKFTNIFDPDLIQKQKDFARNLLNHTNPYTGLRYADDPVIIHIELTNENSLFARYCGDGLNPPNLEDYYSNQLDVKFNEWLLEKYQTRENLENAWQEAGKTGLESDEDPTEGTVKRIKFSERETYSKARFNDTIEFYLELEINYYQEMYDYLRNTLGVKVPISGTNNFYGMPNSMARAGMDYVDAHSYWDHPRYEGGGMGKYPWRISNTPLVKNAGSSLNPLLQLSLMKLASEKPLSVSETNEPFPNKYHVEFPLIVSSYGSFQDWSKLSIHAYSTSSYYSYSGAEYDIEPGLLFDFWVYNNPSFLVQFPVMAKVFREKKVKPGAQTYRIPYTKSEVFDHYYKYCSGIWDSYPNIIGNLKVDRKSYLIHKVRNVFVESLQSVDSELTQSYSNPYVSDTGELKWDEEKGLVTINTPKVQGAVGYLKDAGIISLNDIEIDSSTKFGSIAIISLDDKPIQDSKKLLLVATGSSRNTDMDLRKEGDVYRLYDWGKLPIHTNSIWAGIKLKSNGVVKGIYPLDEKGQKKQPRVPFDKFTNLAVFSINDKYNTLWYGIETE
jgi:hypothetical protein